MTPAEIIQNARKEGVMLSLSPGGTIKVGGERETVNRWLETIREHKADIIASLTVADPVARADPPHWWCITHPDGRTVRLSVWPPSTFDAMQARYPGAAVQPGDPDTQAPTAPLSALEEASIRDWLVLIGEDDPESIAEVIANCRRDSAARSYFTDRAASELGLTLDRFTGTDRRQCSDCRQLGPGGRCRAAARGQLAQTARRHHPDPAQLRRCIAYRPSASDPDQRPGYERWPHLAGTAPARQAAA